MKSLIFMLTLIATSPEIPEDFSGCEIIKDKYSQFYECVDSDGNKAYTNLRRQLTPKEVALNTQQIKERRAKLDALANVSIENRKAKEEAIASLRLRCNNLRYKLIDSFERILSDVKIRHDQLAFKVYKFPGEEKEFTYLQNLIKFFEKDLKEKKETMNEFCVTNAKKLGIQL